MTSVHEECPPVPVNKGRPPLWNDVVCIAPVAQWPIRKAQGSNTHTVHSPHHTSCSKTDGQEHLHGARTVESVL